MAYQSLNPATGKLLKKFEELTNKQLEEKLATAEKCFKNWKLKTYAERAVIVAKAATLMHDRIDELAHTMTLDWNLGALADGLRCYRSQEFFAAHEHWENVWRECHGPEKSFLQALIQLAVACHHLRQNNSRGAASMLKKSLRRLESYPAHFERVDVTLLCREVEAWLEVLEGSSPAIPAPVPQIRLTSLSR